jgi:hypothetical protein
MLGQGGLAGSDFIAERYFRPRASQPAHLDSGFLPDPDGYLGGMLAGDVCRRAQIYKTQCTVLLGEPGMGKSTAMAQRRREVGPHSFFDLRLDGAEDVLRALQNSCAQGGSSGAHIVIDSIDEADITNFASRFVGALGRLTPGALRLELACRSSEWPEVLEAALTAFFGSSEVSYFVIQPLRYVDAASMAEAVGSDPKAFLKAIHERELGALAGVPLTLELLIKVFREEQTFPLRASEIYEKALLLLSRENSQTRGQRDRGRLAPTRILEIASLLAAASVLCNRPRFVQRSALIERAGEIATTHLVPGEQGLDEAMIDDVLATGLFVRGAADTSTFYHHRFREFLAARWLQSSGFTRQQLRQLLFHHESAEHLVPQLSGVASWLACVDPNTAMLLAQLAPEHFIAADSPVATDGHRAAAVDALLRRAENQTLTRYWWPEAESKRLAHPGLAEQLRPYLLGSDRDPFVRRKAAYIAKANGLVALGEDVVALALDETAPGGVRVEAVEAAFACAPDAAAVAQRIRPIVGPRKPETPDDLRAAVLEQLWPKHVDAAELFLLLTRPSGPMKGAYSSFILRIPNDLRTSDLVTALEWAGDAARPYGQLDSWEFEGLAAAIFLKAWAHLEDPACLEAFARAAWRTLKVFRPVLQGRRDDKQAERLLADTSRRRLLLRELVRLAETPDDAYHLEQPHEQPPFALAADIPWFLDERRTAAEPQRALWERLVCRLWSSSPELSTLELILAEIGNEQRTPMLPFPLVMYGDSDEARAVKDRLKQEEVWAAERARRDDEAQRRRDREVKPWLEKAEHGDYDDWARAVVWLHDHRGDAPQKGLLATFAQNSDGPEERAKYLRLAKAFLEEAPTDAARWLSERGTTWFAAVAGYMSVRLVSQFDPDWWTPRASALLTRWAGAIVGFDVYRLHEREDEDAHRFLVDEAFRASPQDVRRALGLLVEREASDHPGLEVLNYLPPGTPIGDLLERALLKNSKRLEGFERIFGCLVRFDLPRAIGFASCALACGNCLIRPLRPPLISCGALRPRRAGLGPRIGDASRYSAHQFAMVRALIAVPKLEAWQLVRRAGHRYPKLARAVAESFADDLRKDWGKQLPDEDLAEFYTWLPELSGVDGDSEAFVPSRDFRHSLLNQLASRGSASAVQALTSLEDAAPNDIAVRRAAAEARHRYRELSWQPVQPATLFEMRRAANRRIVESSEQLLDVVLESIDEYAGLLQGKSQAVDDLWSWTQERKLEDVEYLPKEEEALSGHLKRHLESTLLGVLVNREVEIRPTSVEARSGERVDFLVQAVEPQTLRTWAVVIEVKGSWNPELLTHLDQQLRERYLGTGEYTCGVYLVGWYACSQWGEDWRRDATRRLKRAEVEQYLNERAHRACNAGRTVRLRVLDLSMGTAAAPVAPAS